MLLKLVVRCWLLVVLLWRCCKRISGGGWPSDGGLVLTSLIPSDGACVARTNHHILVKSHESTWSNVATIDHHGGKTSSMKSFDARAIVCLLLR